MSILCVPRSLDPIYIGTYKRKSVKTSWTESTNRTSCPLEKKRGNYVILLQG